MTEKSDAERAAEATRRAIRKMQKPRRKKSGPLIVGQIGHRDSMMFDPEFADVNPIIFDKRDKRWTKHGWMTK